MQDLATIVEAGAEELRKAGIADYRRDARTLILDILGKDTAFFYANSDLKLLPETIESFSESIRLRAKREPLQHITGKQEFYGLEFSVSRDVLIPRPETELIVEKVLETYDAGAPWRFCDVGTGSGCLAVSITSNLPKSTCVAVDNSAAAISVARKNARKHGVQDRISFVESDLFDSVGSETFDFVVSNPPYVSSDEYRKLEPEVIQYDPRNAVTDDADGLSVIGRLAGSVHNYIGANGWFFMEFGFGQSELVTRLFETGVWQNVEVLDDLQSIPRIVVAQKRD